MEAYEDSDLSLRPKNEQQESQLSTTAKKQRQRPQSEKKVRRKGPESSRQPEEISIIDHVYLMHLFRQDLVYKQEKAEEKGRYKTAKSCRNKLSRLKDDLMFQKMKELEETHLQQKIRVREAHHIELDKIDAAWLKMFKSYDRRIQQMVERWQNKKEHQLNKLDFEIEKMNEVGFKLRSKSLKDLQKAKRYYLKEQDYDQVRNIDRQIDQLTYDLFKKSQHSLKTKFVKMQQALETQHSKEQDVLHERIKRAKQEQIMQCDSQKKKTVKKYKNIVSKLEMQQALEIRNFKDIGRLAKGSSLRESRKNARWIIENSGEM